MGAARCMRFDRPGRGALYVVRSTSALSKILVDGSVNKSRMTLVVNNIERASK